MNVSGIPGYHDPLGLFPYAAWLAGHGLFVSLLFCLLLAPLAMVVIAPLFESRFLPLGKNQFGSFFPGSLYLAIATAILLVLAGDLPHEAHWYNSFWWNLLLQLGAIIAAVGLTYGAYRTKIYPPRALRSPTKVFNNLLYAFYGYVTVEVFTAVLFGSDWGFWFGVKQTVAWYFLYLWLRRIIRDARLPKTNPEAYKRKLAHAHVADWQPLWVSLGTTTEERRPTS